MYTHMHETLFPVLVCVVLNFIAAETINYPSKLHEKLQRIAVTSANWPVVTPGSQCICHSLTSDALRTLQHITVFTGKLYTCTHPRRKRAEGKKGIKYILISTSSNKLPSCNISRSK